LEENLGRIRDAIAAGCRLAGRAAGDVTLVAVAKGVPPQLVEWAREAGVDDFGENYVQELERKRDAVGPARWHFVGPLQSHTAHRVASSADVVHTLAPGRAASRLAHRAAEERGPDRRIPALIQVDFTGRRYGASPDAVPAFADEAIRMHGVAVTGLMTLPPMPERPEDSRPYFRKLRALRDDLAERDPGISELSMGMSDDYQVAVEEGATMVRIGTALFGGRPAVSAPAS
jgi:PLP dependent protein